MVKKTLEEKIKLVCWWALGLTILYFIIGAWLISDGPIFDPTKTYNLLKDTLTLTAAFLAPVVAFVLFSDWREQHKTIRNETIVIKVIQGLKIRSDKIKTMVGLVHQEFQENPDEMVEMFSEDLASSRREIIKELGDLENTRLSFLDRGFHDKAIEFYQMQYDLLNTLDRLFDFSKSLYDCRNSPTDPDYMDWITKTTNQFEMKFLEEAEAYLAGFYNKIKEISTLAKPYVIL